VDFYEGKNKSSQNIKIATTGITQDHLNRFRSLKKEIMEDYGKK
jgi:hypothetical protein